MKTLMSNPQIATQICNLDRYIDGNEKAIEFIKNRLFNALSARFENKSDLSAYIYEDTDPLGRTQTAELEEGDTLYDAVREIQLNILNSFGE